MLGGSSMKRLKGRPQISDFRLQMGHSPVNALKRNSLIDVKKVE
jgi:hypothetical protein